MRKNDQEFRLRFADHEHKAKSSNFVDGNLH